MPITKRKVNSASTRIFNYAAPGSNTRRLLKRFAIALMLLLAVIMVIYYAFIRSDEAMLEAGRSDAPTEQEYDAADEKYGYETKQTEAIDDRVSDDGSADTDASATEEETNDEASQPETTEETAEPAAEPATEPAPASEPEMPILQE